MTLDPMRMKFGIPSLKLHDPIQVDLAHLISSLKNLDNNTKVLLLYEKDDIQETCWGDIKDMILENTDKIEPFSLDTNTFYFSQNNITIFVVIIRNSKCFTSEYKISRNPFATRKNRPNSNGGYTFRKSIAKNKKSIAKHKAKTKSKSRKRN